MVKVTKGLIIIAAICLIVAILIKITTLGKIVPGPMPINWAKLADTALLFSIAISLLGKK